MIRSPRCEHCGDSDIAVLCWVSVDGKILETTGAKGGPDGEPPQMAWCGGRCGISSPPEGTMFVVKGGQIEIVGTP